MPSNAEILTAHESDFMEPQITDEHAWYQVESEQGEECIVPAWLTSCDAEHVAPYCTFLGLVAEIETVRGFGARFSAPGYMDCTKWAVFDTEKEAEEYLVGQLSCDDLCPACGHLA